MKLHVHRRGGGVSLQVFKVSCSHTESGGGGGAEYKTRWAGGLDAGVLGKPWSSLVRGFSVYTIKA